MKPHATLLAVTALLTLFGCEPNSQSADSDPATVAPSADDFMGSCMAGNLSAVQRALDAGIDPDVYYSDGNTTCMIQAAAGGNAEIVRALLEAGANPDLKRASDGYTALINAALQGRTGVVRVLIEGGADPTIENSFGQDAAAVARLRDHYALADEIASADGPSAAPEPTGSSDGRRVTAAMFGDDWPLTISEGELDCPRGNEVVIRSGGRVYALNGKARSNPEYEDLRSVWRDNPSLPGTKVPPSALIDRGLRLCR